MNKTIRFPKGDTSFYEDVKHGVAEYFEKNHLSKNANGWMYFKTFFFGGGALGLYLLILLSEPAWYTILIAALFGFMQACIGFNISHDSIHGAYSSRGWINKLVGSSFYMIGANAYMWNITHNIVHHTFTNIHEHDEDVEVAPGLLRLHPADERHGIQRFQHLYAFPLYALSSINWVLRKDFKKFVQKKIGEFDAGAHSPIRWVELIGSKLVYYFFILVLPYLLLDVSFWWILLGFVVMHLVMGLTLGLVFQLAHVVSGVSFPQTESGKMEENWAIHQMCTTANFAPKSPLAAFICGGLNMQIEHHLFPKVCHVHYPAISKIVKNVAEKHNVPYIENQTFWSALRSHYGLLKQFGRS